MPQFVVALEAALRRKVVDREARIAEIVNADHRRLSTADGRTPGYPLVDGFFVDLIIPSGSQGTLCALGP